MKTLEDFAAEREGARLEFKGREALEDPRILPRAVCALLNSGGGQVIVGLKERPGGGFVPDPVPDPERARGAVLDRLISSIEPPAALKVEVLQGLAGDGLRIVVPKSPELHALREKRGMVSFVSRVEDRTVPMTWTEVQRRLAHRTSRGVAKTGDGAASTREALAAWRRDLQRGAPSLELGGALLLVVKLVPETPFPEGWERDLKSWYDNPTAIGLRRIGCHFLWHEDPPRPSSDARKARPGVAGLRSSGSWRSGRRIALYSPAGELAVATSLDSLRRGRGEGEGNPDALHQVMLIELVSACARIFGALWRGGEALPAGVEAWGGLSLTGAQGLRLPPFRAESFGSASPERWAPPWEGPELGPFLARLTREELLASPERLAHRLLLTLYRELGYDEHHLPYFDPDRGRFVFD